MVDCVSVFWSENKSKDSVPSGASLCGPDHSLFHALSALEIFETLVLEDINIELLHDLQDNIETLEEAVHRDTKHAVGSGAVNSAKYGGIILIRCGLCRLNSVQRSDGSGIGQERGAKGVMLDCIRRSI